MKAHDEAVMHLSVEATSAENSTHVLINVQLGGAQLHFVLITLCTGRDWDRIANALRGWSTRVR